jgi:hypothetical protein
VLWKGRNQKRQEDKMVERYADEKFQEWRNMPARKGGNILRAFILRVFLTSPPTNNQSKNAATNMQIGRGAL